jgi:hypothetical protein
MKLMRTVQDSGTAQDRPRPCDYQPRAGPACYSETAPSEGLVRYALGNISLVPRALSA